MSDLLKKRFAVLAANPEAVIVLAGVTAVLVVAVVVIGLVGSWVTAAFFLPIAVAPGFMIIAAHRVHRASLATHTEQSIMLHLRQAGARHFDLEQALGDSRVPKKALTSACLAVYAKCVEGVLRDLKITEEETKRLRMLRAKLNIDDSLAEQIEEHHRNKAYQKKLDKCLADGVISEAESRELQDIRVAIGLTDCEALSITRENVTDAYRALFRQFASDGRLSRQELAQLREFASATGLSPDEAANISKKDALNLYRRTVSMVCQDGIVTKDETDTLNELASVLRLPFEDMVEFKRQVDRTRMLGEIRMGKLPKTSSGNYTLKSTELCHWKTRATYQYETQTRTNSFQGMLVVTNNRVIFVSPERSFEFRHRRIINVYALSNAVELRLTTTKGQGVYFVQEADLLSAILDALVKKHNFFLSENFDSERSRRIADDVKVAVWERDGGVCAKCGAREYLEYDHIIPFSKGGSNSERNIQLLCRKCNLAKGGELV